MSEPLFQKLINKFEGVRLDWRGLFGSDSEEIQNVIDVIREIQAAHIDFQKKLSELEKTLVEDEAIPYEYFSDYYNIANQLIGKTF